MRTCAEGGRELAGRTGERLQRDPSTLHKKRMLSGAPGQELVELALLIPLMLLIAVGVLDLGRLFHASITIANAAREGARFGMYDPSNVPGIEAAARAEAVGSGIDIPGGGIAVSCPDGSCGSGLPVRVAISYPFQLVMGLVFPDPNLTLGGAAEMMVP